MAKCSLSISIFGITNPNFQNSLDANSGIGVFIYKEVFLTAGLYAAFVGLAAYGWWQWQQVKQKQLGHA